MIVSIHQPNYIPWIGYFHKIFHSDVFVVLDNVQYVKGTVANRNSIKAKDGKETLLSVSVRLSKGSFQKYNEMEIDYSGKWNSKHLNKIKDAYSRAANFKTIYPEIESILKKEFYTIGELNITLIKWVLQYLDIKTKIIIASSLNKDFGAQNEQNCNLCKEFGATIYLSGNGARKYNDESLFTANNIKLIYTQYTSPVYSQPGVNFIPNLSILDLLFNESKENALKAIIIKEKMYDNQ